MWLALDGSLPLGGLTQFWTSGDNNPCALDFLLVTGLAALKHREHVWCSSCADSGTVTRAAEAASQAALALKESNQQARSQRSGFSEASKVVKCPSSFGNANSGEDQPHWLDFSSAFKQWLFYAKPE